MNANRKISWISTANILACLGVIILHTNGVFWTFPQGKVWYTSNFTETFFYWPVPVFFMISGATLLNYRNRYPTKVYFAKRFVKVVIPFCFWSLFSLVWHIVVYGNSIDSLNGIKSILSGLLNARYNTKYWFFIPLFSVYLSIPLLSAVSEQLRKKTFAFTAAAAFILISVMPTFFSLLGMEYNTSLNVSACGGYIIYVLLGYLICNTDLKPVHRWIVYALGIIGWFIHFEGTSYLSLSAGAIDTTFKDYLNFPTVMQSIGIFVFIKYANWDKIANGKLSTFAVKISKYTFGVYLIHQYVLYTVQCKFPALIGFDVGNIPLGLLTSLLIFSVCLLISWLLSEIPFMGWIVGTDTKRINTKKMGL